MDKILEEPTSAEQQVRAGGISALNWHEPAK